jgi:mRNA interferase MazF
MMIPLRGEVWWVELDPTRGYELQKTRPCVVISSDDFNRYRNTHLVVGLSTTSPKKWPLYVPVPSVSPTTQAVIDQVRAMDKSRFRSRKGAVSAADMERIDEALRVVLDLE